MYETLEAIKDAMSFMDALRKEYAFRYYKADRMTECLKFLSCFPTLLFTLIK